MVRHQVFGVVFSLIGVACAGETGGPDASRASMFSNALLHREKHALGDDITKLSFSAKKELEQRARVLKNSKKEELRKLAESTLSSCWQWKEGDTPFGEYTALHPCFNEKCAAKKTSQGCLDNVFEMCCDESLSECNPSEDMKQLRELAPCSPQSCSAFMMHGDTIEKDHEAGFGECPFTSNEAICTQACANEMYAIYASWQMDDCQWNDQCLRNYVDSYTPEIGEKLGKFSYELKRRAALGRNLQEQRLSQLGINFRKLQETVSPTEEVVCQPSSLVMLANEMPQVWDCIEKGTNSTGELCAGTSACLDMANSVLGISEGEPQQENEKMACTFQAAMAALDNADLEQWAKDLWGESREKIPDSESLWVIVNVFNAFSGCDDGQGDGQGDGQSDNERPPCTAQDMEPLFFNFFDKQSEHDVLGCIGESVPDSCPDISKCVAVLMAAVGEGNALICLEDIAKEVQNDVENALEAVVGPVEIPHASLQNIQYLATLYMRASVCFGDEGGNDEGGEIDPDWNLEAECHPELEEAALRCGAGCCNLHNKITNGSFSIYDFGSPGDKAFGCGQIYLKTRDKEAVYSCLRFECGGCYEEGGGLYGGLTFSERENSRDPYQTECVSAIHDYCVANPMSAECKPACDFDRCDTRSNDNCPCENAQCSLLLQESFAENNKCAEFKDRVLRDFIAQGFLWPEEEYQREQLIRAGASIRESAPDYDFVLPNTTLAVAQAGGCSFIDDIVQCTRAEIEYCNTPQGFWEPGCHKLSSCGDGLVTWGEQCDDGNKRKYDDGCSDCRYVPQDWYCPQEGNECQYCVRNNVDHDPHSGDNSDKGCPFCLNKRTEALVSPCSREECKVVRNYEEGKRCDSMVAEFCQALESLGYKDPGCDTWESSADKFARPIIEQCTVTEVPIETEAQHLKAVKFLVFECPVTDPTNEGRDTEPYVPYWSPFIGLSEEQKKEVDPSVLAALELYSLAERDTLVPLSNLTDHETNLRSDPVLQDALGKLHEHSVSLLSRTARLQLWEPVSHGDWEPQCDANYHPEGQLDLKILPSCEDPIASIARQFAQRAKYSAVVEEWSNTESFKDIDLSTFTGLECAPKRGVVQMAMQISETYMEWTGNSERREERYFDNHCWDWRDKNGLDESAECPSIEDLIRSGEAKIHFGGQLFAKSCASKDCKERISGCTQVPLKPRQPKSTKEAFARAADLVRDAILKLKDAQSASDLQRISFEINAMVNSLAIQDAFKYFRQLTVREETSKTLTGVKDYCPHDYWVVNTTTWSWSQNEDWTKDPCCNWELRQYQCCPVQDVPGAKFFAVVGFDENAVKNQCSNPDKITSVLVDFFHFYEDSKKRADELGESESPKDFLEKLHDWESTCRESIDMQGEAPTSQADCYCKYSTYSADSQRCETPPSAWPLCYADCFRSEHEEGNMLLIQFLREEWGIQNDTLDGREFALAWREKMTAGGCAGERAWESDIGYAGYHWTCDSECQSQHMCDYYQNAEHYLRSTSDSTDHHVSYWELSQSNETCAAHGGNRTCRSEWDCRCELPGVANGPCGDRQECYDECYTPCMSQGACEVGGGTWLQNDEFGGGECCPSEGYVRQDEWDTSRYYCSALPPGKPNSWELNDELCCAAEGGTWMRHEGRGQCCLGRIKQYNHDGTTNFYCEEHMSAWDECHECEQTKCRPLDEECFSCYKESEKCCSEQLVEQNMTACLSYTDCNDRSDNHHPNDGTCSGDEPFCTNEWGWPEGESARCELHVWDQETCASLGGTYDHSCKLPVAANATSPSQGCFPEEVCPVKTFAERFPGWKEPANGYRTEGHCESGCYVPAEDGLSYTIGWKNEWNCNLVVGDRNIWGRYINASDMCQVSDWELEQLGKASKQDACAFLANGTSFHHFQAGHTWFRAGTRQTKESCEAGRCEGTINEWKMHPETYEWLGDQAWSEDQCLNGSEMMCSRWCSYCHTDRTEGKEGACYNDDGLGGFLRNETIKNNETCTSSGLTWYACPSVDSKAFEDWGQFDQTCRGGGSLPPTVASDLQCYPTGERCKTSAECESMGDCHGVYGWLDLESRWCEDPSWEHGDRHWAAGNNGDWVSCTMPKWSKGVCIKDRNDDGTCNSTGTDIWWRYHIFGCRTDLLRTAEACDAAGTGYTWHNPIANKEECEAISACRLNRWDVRQFSSSECARCGGDTVPFAMWYGGTMDKPFVRPMRWHARKEQQPVNEWVPTQQLYKVKEQLQRPVIRNFAQQKQSKLLTKYNSYRSVLEKIACDCGQTAGECFGSDSADLAAKSAVVAGASNTIGYGVIAQGVPAAESARRRRRLSAGGDASGDVSVSLVSSGVYDRYEPCSSGDLSLDTLVVVQSVENPELVVGQLLGDGRRVDFDASSIESILVCMPRRNDINIRNGIDSSFTTVGAAFKDPDSGHIVPLLFDNDNETYVERTEAQVCIGGDSLIAGTYYPILRVADDVLTTASSTTCDGTCGISACILGSSGSGECLCRCGLSGTSCEIGCLDNCGGNGECNAALNQCTCTAGANGVPLYQGKSCARLNCPIDAEDNLCSGNGLCSIDENVAKCVCESEFMGDDCGTPVPRDTSSGEDAGFGSSDDSIPDEPDSFEFETPPPTRNPTPRPTKPRPEPLVTLKLTVDPSLMAPPAQGEAPKSVAAELGAVKQAMLDKLPPAARALTDVEVSVENKAMGSCVMTLSSTDDAALAVVRAAIAHVQCGTLTTCSVTISIGTRRQLTVRRTLATSIDYEIVKVYGENDSIEYIPPLNTSSLEAAIVEETSEQGIELDVTVANLTVPTTQDKIVVQAIPTAEALSSIEEADEMETFDVSAVQNSFSDTDEIADVVASSANVTVAETEQDFCAGRDCSFQGQCIQDSNSSRCECDEPYTGFQCEIVPTAAPTMAPTGTPSLSPTDGPSEAPTDAPTDGQLLSSANSPFVSIVATLFSVLLAVTSLL